MASGNDVATGEEMKAAQATYDGFINLVKWSMPIIAVIAATVVYLISR